ncbi:NAD(P)-dependent oxidoreductase [Candidatus Enterococcus ferrettii]|uniref:NAD(P)-binding domain-containing protein n=1 Tax=Candidatus Enterococcus ferrettii TaxID=2815324 RepID=A0ABV0ERU6_9ENTE|nr:NAD(P)H-binding protein [Enterococcus sp. 665A]MBO1342015.1 NAD(P)H-binding protein [Enterococcus sp. 665A]
MKLAIIGATGHAGSLILNEALERQIDVTAIVRHPEKLVVDVPYLKKDLYDLTQDDLSKFDVVIDAFRPPMGKEELHQSSLQHLIDILSGTATRLLVVGGASSLYLDDERTKRMIDVSDPNAPYYPTAYNMYQAYLELPKAKDLQWSYLSPAANFVPDGSRTGNYQLSDNRLKKNAEGQSDISMADYAIAMVDEALKNQHGNQHFSVVSL